MSPTLSISLKNIYLQSFTFYATRYEEILNGKGFINKGYIDCSILVEKLNDKCMGIRLFGQMPNNINTNFGLPIFGIDRGDILKDRIMYGRFPDEFSWDDPNEPLICEIFNTMDRIRFAMLSPLRTIEFYGKLQKS